MSTRTGTLPSLCHPAAPKRTGVLSFLRWLDAQYRARRQLARLDGHLRQDIGLSDASRAAELARTSWDVPAWWR